MKKLSRICRALPVPALCLLLGVGGVASAAEATATFTDTCSNGREGPNPYCDAQDFQLMNQRIVVSVTPDSQHVGHIGGFYVGLRTDGNVRGVFTPDGWKGFNGGIFEPAAVFDSMPGGTQTFVVFDKGFLCSSVGSGTSELWAGYGSLDTTTESQLKTLMTSVSKGLTYEHLVRTYVQSEMTKSQRAWKVLEVTCQTGGSNDGAN